MTIKFKKLCPLAKIPSYAKEGDIGLDLTATEVIEKEAYIEYKTGLAVEIPEGYGGFLFPRSSITNMGLMLKNSVGVIDQGYRGELCFRMTLANQGDLKYQCGDRVGQLVILPIGRAEEILEIDELSESIRGEGGFGSTGK